MPKKWKGENSKSAEVRERKETRKQVEKEEKLRDAEDKYWQDDDKHVVRKQQRKEEKEKKKEEVAERKLFSKALLEKEMEEIGSSKGAMTRNQSASKITQSAIVAQQEKDRLEKERQEEIRKLQQKKISLQDDLLVENVNHLTIEGEHARTVDEAIRIVSDKPQEIDQHPEKRMRAAYNAFETRMLPQLKQDHPTYRLSQLKQLVKKEWNKSPENPLVQRLIQINSSSK